MSKIISTRFIITFCLFIKINYTNAQIGNLKWDVINDTITLSPNRITSNGFFNYSKFTGDDRQFDGNFTILLKEESVFYKDGLNLLKLKYSDINGLGLDGYRFLKSSDINDKGFPDTLSQMYRAKIFKSLKLNEVEVLFSKKNRIELTNAGLKVKNPIIKKGKICAISTQKIVLVTEEGELVNLSDGDFINITVGEFKSFECVELYNYIFNFFKIDLNNSIKKWETQIKETNLETLVQNIGPFNEIKILPNNNKLYVWKIPMSKHYINMHSSVSSYSNTNSFSIYNQNISPLFGYSNTYRNMTSNTFSSNFTTTKIIQGGEVSTFDESIILSLTLDVNNVISKVYHERIFSELNYGQPFRFINY